MAKYVSIKVMNENLVPVDKKVRAVKVQGKFVLHKKYREEGRGVYSITCLQSGTAMLLHIEGLNNGLFILNNMAETFPYFDFDNKDHKEEAWSYVQKHFFRKTIFG